MIYVTIYFYITLYITVLLYISTIYQYLPTSRHYYSFPRVPDTRASMAFMFLWENRDIIILI